jgi:hypothetical protein
MTQPPAPAKALLLILAFAAFGPSAWAQKPEPEQVDRFLKYLRNPNYTELLGRKALETDAEMPPECGERALAGRTLFAVTEQPVFIDSRNVPVEGSWAERVAVRRCGTVVEHNIYFFASKVRGLHAVAGFPGRTLTQPQLQFEVARKLLATGRRLAPRCKSFDVVQTELISKPRNRTEAWTERWSLYMCGEIHQQRVRFTPDSQGRTAFRLAD